MSIGIYKIVSPSGRIYIGQSRNIENRMISYRRSGARSQPILYRSFKKYGFSNHTIEILEICDESILDERECYYIDVFDTWQTDHGMNCRAGGSFGKHSDYSNELNRQAHLGKKHKPETLARYKELAAPKIGVKRDPEIGKKISAKKKGNTVFSDEHKAKLRESCMNSELWRKAHRIKSDKQQKPVINTETGEIWPSAKIAAISNGINVGTLTPKLNGTFKNHTPFRYL